LENRFRKELAIGGRGPVRQQSTLDRSVGHFEERLGFGDELVRTVLGDFVQQSGTSVHHQREIPLEIPGRPPRAERVVHAFLTAQQPTVKCQQRRRRTAGGRKLFGSVNAPVPGFAQAAIIEQNEPRPASRAFLELIDFELQLSDSLELDVEIAAHLIETLAVLLEDLTALVQQVDHVIKLSARHVEAAGFWYPRNRADASLECHWEGLRRAPTILMLSWLSRKRARSLSPFCRENDDVRPRRDWCRSRQGVFL
jgi:hypothetical protein